MRYRLSRSAKRDLNEIFVYWSQRAGVEAADKIVDSILEHFPNLQNFPQIGRRCEDFGPGTRCFPAGQYLVYYKRNRGITSILHVVHGARDQRKVFRRAKPS
jgi:toxin ParE1/3/4